MPLVAGRLVKKVYTLKIKTQSFRVGGRLCSCSCTENIRTREKTYLRTRSIQKVFKVRKSVCKTKMYMVFLQNAVTAEVIGDLFKINRHLF